MISAVLCDPHICMTCTLNIKFKVVEESDGTKRVQSSREATPARLQNQIDQAIGGHRTSSAVINGGCGMGTRGRFDHKYNIIIHTCTCIMWFCKMTLLNQTWNVHYDHGAVVMIDMKVICFWLTQRHYAIISFCHRLENIRSSDYQTWSSSSKIEEYLRPQKLRRWG